ncbi:hypothetical protein AOLI_G00330090 [Acnodon oligacanthus]
MVERVRAGAPEMSKPTRGFYCGWGGFSYPKTIQPRESRRTDAPAASARSTTVTRRGYFPPRRLTETPKGSRGTVLPVSARLRGPAAGMAQPSRLPSLPPVTEMAGAGEKTERFGGRPCLLGPDPTARDRGAGTYGKTERLRGRPWRRDLLRRAINFSPPEPSEPSPPWGGEPGLRNAHLRPAWCRAQNISKSRRDESPERPPRGKGRPVVHARRRPTWFSCNEYEPARPSEEVRTTGGSVGRRHPTGPYRSGSPHRNLQNRARRGEASPAFGTPVYDPRGVEFKIFQSPDATKAPSDPRGVRDARSGKPVVAGLCSVHGAGRNRTEL